MTHGYGVLFSKKTGKVVKVLEGNLPMLKMFAMNNVSPTRGYVVIDDTNTIVMYVTGRQGALPQIHKELEGCDSIEELGIDISML